MAKMTDVFKAYEKGSAKERAEIIFNNYCSFLGIIDYWEKRLLYEIELEEQFCRSTHKGELGVRIQRLGNYSDTTAQQAVENVIIRESIEGNGKLALRDCISTKEREKLERMHYVLIVMREEYDSFEKYLYALMPEEQQIIIPFLKHEKDCGELAQELGVALGTVYVRISRIRKELLSDMETFFADRITEETK